MAVATETLLANCQILRSSSFFHLPPRAKTKPRVEIEFIRMHAHCDYKMRRFPYDVGCDRRQREGLRDREAGWTACSCAQFWWSFGYGRNSLLILSCFLCLLNNKKLDQMLKPAEELHVSNLVFTCSKKVVLPLSYALAQ